MPRCIDCENAFPFPAPVEYRSPSGKRETIFGRCIIKDEDFTDEGAIDIERECKFFVKEIMTTKPQNDEKPEMRLDELIEFSDSQAPSEEDGKKDSNEEEDGEEAGDSKKIEYEGDQGEDEGEDEDGLESPAIMTSRNNIFDEEEEL